MYIIHDHEKIPQTFAYVCILRTHYVSNHDPYENNAVANSVTGAAQPALLYLVPSLLIGVFTMASIRSEASLLWDFRDEKPMGE